MHELLRNRSYVGIFFNFLGANFGLLVLGPRSPTWKTACIRTGLPYCFSPQFRDKVVTFLLSYNLRNSSQNFKATAQDLKKVFPSFFHPLCPIWVHSGTFISPFIVLNLNISFNLCARLGFKIIWLVKHMKIRKSKIEIICI